MLKVLMAVLAVTVLLWGGAPYAHGQQATEIYIPVGQSPGVSGKISVIGKVESVDAGDRSISVAGPAGTWKAKITDRTKVWLDRSRLKLSNLTGSFADLRRGQVVEVKYEGTERKSEAPCEWIKVQVETK